jgi:penicillin-binding protein 1A
MGGSGRQPGSAFKPFVITAALEDGLSAGLTLDARGPQDIEGCNDPSTESGLWEPRNSGGNDILDMYEAIARSSNVYHALLIAEIGPGEAAEMFRRLSGYGPRDDIFCPLALGATDVTPLEMAAPTRRSPTAASTARRSRSTRIEDPTAACSGSTTRLRAGDRHRGRRPRRRHARRAGLRGDRPGRQPRRVADAGKTGTTNDNRRRLVRRLRQAAGDRGLDRLPEQQPHLRDRGAGTRRLRRAAGEQPPRVPATDTQLLRNVTIAGQSYSQVFGGTIPAPMWADYMSTVVERYEPEGFPDPGPLPTAPVPDLLQAGRSRRPRTSRWPPASARVEDVEDYRPAGTFVGQTPRPAPPAARRIIRLEISDGTGLPPVIPDLIGLTLDEASAILFDIGYRNLFSREQPVEDEDQIGRIVATGPGAGTPSTRRTPAIGSCW